MNSQVGGIYNNYVTNAANKSRPTQELADMMSRLLLNKPFSQLAASEKSTVLMIVSAAQRSFGGVVGQDPAANFSTIYSGVAASSMGMPISGLGTGRSSASYGGPAAMVASGAAFSAMDRYLNGNKHQFTTGTSTGLAASTAAGYLSQFFQARGGMQMGDVQRFAIPANVAAQFQTLGNMQRRTSMSKDDTNQVYSTMLNAHMLDMYARREKGERGGYDSMTAADQAKMRDEMKAKFASMNEAERKRYQEDIRKSLRKEYESQLTRQHKRNGKWEEGWNAERVANEASLQFDLMTKSGAMADLSAQGVDAGVRTREGRTDYTKGTRQLEEVTKKALAAADRTLADMTEVFGTDNFEELMAQANKFGVTTMASEQQARKMRNIIDAARARAAATGRTVQETMAEYGQVATMGAAVFGGAQYMPAHYLRTFDQAQRANAANRASGFETRTEEELAAEHAATMANDAEHYTEATWAIEHGADNGDERMRHWRKRLMEAKSGKPLTEEERQQMLAETGDYFTANGTHMTPQALKAFYANSQMSGTMTEALNAGSRETFSKMHANNITLEWQDKQNSLAYKQLFQSNVLGKTDEETQAVLEQGISDILHEYGSDNASMMSMFGKNGTLQTLLDANNGDVEKVKSAIAEEMKSQGRSEEDIARQLNAVEMMSKLNTQQRQRVLEGVEFGQRDTQRVGVGAANAHKNTQAELQAEQEANRLKSQGVMTRLASNDLSTFLIHGQDGTEQSTLLATTYSAFESAGIEGIVGAADGNIAADAHNDYLNMTDEQLRSKGITKQSDLDRIARMRGNQMALKAGENKGELSAEFARKEAQRLNSAAANLERRIADETDPEKKKRLQAMLEQVQTRQNLFQTVTGLTTKEMAESDMSDAAFTTHVNENKLERGLADAAVDAQGDMIFSADASKVEQSASEFRQREMVKMLTHMSGTGLDPITLKEAKEGDPEAIQSLLQSAAGNERIQELLRIAEETGGAIKVSEATTDKNGNKVPAGVSINGQLVTDVRDQNQLIYKHALSKEGGAAALLERAMNGDTVAAAAVTQNLIDKHHGDSADGFKYLNLAKGLREGGVKGIDVDAVRTKETELDNLLNQAKSGTPLNPEQIQRVQALSEELEELTKHARNNDDLLSKMEEEEHITAVQATRNIGNGTTSLFDQAKAERSEEEKAAAAAREQQEQETECRTKVTELAKKLLEAFDDKGRLQVETDSW